jgi:[acyl-carrier-protein] S-malonyltransferase
MLALVFPGQGSQSVGMGKDLWDRFPEARAALAEADDALGFPLSKLCFEGPEDELRLTENTQPAILAVSIAAWRALKSRGEPTPAFAAGHSLGEYSALVAAEAIPFADALRAVRARGGFMQAAVPERLGAMAAVLGLAAEEVARACADAAQGEVVSAANLNAPDQTVISGHAGAVERAGALCKERGARRVVPLPVSAPFHCALMEPAARRMAAVLDHTPIAAPRFPVLCNVLAEPVSDPHQIRALLLRQITAPVRWHESVNAMVALGVRSFLEVGPGQVLSGLVRRIHREASVHSVEDGASLEKALGVLA